MLNTKSLIIRKKINQVHSDKEFEERNIEENLKILENNKIINNLETEEIKPSIFIKENTLKEDRISNNIFDAEYKKELYNEEKKREDRIGNIFDAEYKKELYNEEKKREEVYYDDDSNSYIIIDYDNEKKILKNEDILNYIFSNKNNLLIKNYIFTINYNIINKQFEFNLIVSKFTENIEIMIKLLNFVNDYIDNNGKNMNENIDKLMIFFYQTIIFLFRNILQVSKYDKLKLAKYSSYLSYKYSTMVLKKISIIEKNNLIINDTFHSLYNIKKNLLSQFTEISSLYNSNLQVHTSLNKNTKKTDSNVEESLHLNRSGKYKLNSKNVINQNLENNKLISDSSYTNSNNEYNLKNMMNFFSDENLNNENLNSEKSSEENNYQELDTSSDENLLITEDKSNINNMNQESEKISNNSDIIEILDKDTLSENLYSNNLDSNKFKFSNLKSKSEQSYNTNSAFINSKLYELNL